MPRNDSDQALARRWKDRVRFVINDRAEFQAEWRSPALIPAALRGAFEEEIRRAGPSLSALRHLESAILEYARNLEPLERKIFALLDRYGFKPFAR
jgi:hypothetical protein